MRKYIELDGLKHYHQLLMKTVRAEIQLQTTGLCNCPNCGAPIKSEECEYCGTNFMIWPEKENK